MNHLHRISDWNGLNIRNLAVTYMAVSATFVLSSGDPVDALNSNEKKEHSIPLVYADENHYEHASGPELLPLNELPKVFPLTDPFEWSDASGRSTQFEDWARRRAEIQAEIEHYEIGPKPDLPDSITASFNDGLLTVHINENGETLTLTSRISLPEGPGPFPAVIGIGRGSGSLPSDIFSERNIAQVAFNFSQVMAHTQTRGEEPINILYPDLTHIGAYSAWSWGVSRLIDGLELTQDQLPIDLNRLAVTGCSFAGKMALFAGAFDERIALTIAQEPGGGGAAAWRVSETMGNVEKLGATSRAWFMESMFQFSGSNVWKLPMDHHELMSMVAPRALLVLGNPDYQWLADESGYVSCRAAHEVWKTFGIGDRFGFSFVADHPHCRLPEVQRPEVEAFVDKFLLGKTDVDTHVETHPFSDTDYKRWYQWWGTSKPALTGSDNAYTVTIEAEDGVVGSNWNRMEFADSVEGQYLTPKIGSENIQTAPSSQEGLIVIPIELKRSAKFTLFARLNCPSADDDSCWLKIDDADYKMKNGLGTSGWQWITLDSLELKAGTHTLTVGSREDGFQIDKISLSTFFLPPM